MNNVILLGRLTKDFELKYSTGEKATAFSNNSIAVNRSYKNAEGKYDADFINISTIGKTAEIMANHLHKGDMVCIQGHIQTRNYTNKDGVKVYVTEVVVDKFSFCGGKSEGSSAPKVDDGFVNLPDAIEEELPFM